VRLLLDTNAYSAMRRGHPVVSELIRRSERVLLSAVVVGELMFGFRHGSRPQPNLQALDEFVRLPEVKTLPVTLVTADRYARLFHSLRRQGRPIPTNDVWIAAHAMESGADLVSFDRHFAALDEIVWVDPSAA